MPSMMAKSELTRDQKIAYLAAFIDGEGHVGLHPTKQGHWTRHISFCNTDIQLFEFVVSICRELGFKVSIQEDKKLQENPKRARRKICYIARSRDSIELFAKLIPIQAERKKQALAKILQSWATEEDFKKRRNGKETKCEVCEKPVYASKSFRNRGGGRFCSVACRGIYQRKRVIKKCETCSVEYEVIAANAQNSRFCSLRCYGLSNADRMRAMAKSAAEARWGK